MLYSPRRRAREVVLQILYGDDLNPQRNQGRVTHFLRDRLNNDLEMVALAEALLAGVRHKREEIDNHLQSLSDHWSLARMSATDRNVLRMGAFEILYGEKPRPVAINEALELARRYGTKTSTQFVNGVLDKIKTYEPPPTEAKAAEGEVVPAEQVISSEPNVPSEPTQPIQDEQK